MRDMRGAVALLTVFPAGRHDAGPTPGVAAWFPWVGLMLGGVSLTLVAVVNVASVAWGDGGMLVRAAWPFAALVVFVGAALTRMLHWDGLADVADAWWGGANAARRLEIMADSSIGAFGATTVALTAIAQVSAVAVLIQEPGFGIALFAAPVFGRAAAMFGAWLGRSARPGGLGSLVVGSPRVGAIAIASLALALAAASMIVEHGRPGGAWSAGCFLVALVVPHLIAGRFGGVTGDVLGASVLVTETVCLTAAAMVVAW